MEFTDWLWISAFHGLFFALGLLSVFRIRAVLLEVRSHRSLRPYSAQAMRVGGFYRLTCWTVLGGMSLSYYLLSLQTLFSEL